MKFLSSQNTKKRIVYNIFGIKISCKKKKKRFSSRIVNKILHESKVPLTCNSSFVRFKEFPIKAEDYKLKSSHTEPVSIGIVIQGPIIKENDFTLETCKIYKKIFNNDEKIILSTWNNEDDDYLEKFRNLDVIVVTSEVPECYGHGNVNCQIKSTLVGCEKAKEIGSKYILKTRTDQRFYARDISQYLLNLLKMFPLRVDAGLKERLVALTFNTFKYRRYGISDMFLFGNTDDVIKYWSVPERGMDIEVDRASISKVEYILKYCPETYIVKNFLKNIGIIPDDTLKQSLEIYRDLFCFIDKEQLDFYWPKYSNEDKRWNFYYENCLEEFHFKDWLNLYSGTLDIENYCEKSFDLVPEI